MSTSDLLDITELAATQEERSVTVNEAIAKLESGAGLFPALDVNLDTPPGGPSAGDVYVLGLSPTGAWSGHAEEIARYLNGSWRFMPPRSGLIAYAVNDGLYYGYVTGYGWDPLNIGSGTITESFVIACSDETTALTSGTAKVTFRMPYALTVTAVKASLTTAQTSGSTFTVDINDGGTTILSTKLTIDNTEKTSATAATPAVISDSALAADAEVTIDIDTVGDGTAKGLKVCIIGHQ